MKISTTLLVAASLGALSSRAALADCPAIVNATLKMVTTPYRMVMDRDDSTHRHSEMIQTSDTTYMLIKDKWRAIPYDSQERLKDMKESASEQKISCESLGRETVDGQRTERYSAKTDLGENGSSAGDVWISVDTGLIVKEHLIHTDEGKKTTADIRYDYSHVSAPADAVPLARGKK
jgi:hypothetical protein